MILRGYANPLRGMERSMGAGTPNREFRDPGMGGMSGLGSLHHTMPHLRRLSGTPHFDVGGLTNPVGNEIAASHPNTFNPDPRFRQTMQNIRNMSMTNPSLRTISTATPFVYQEGGEAPDPEEAMQPDEEMSPDEQQQHQVVMDALAALDGQNPDAEAALKRFIDTFGPRALVDLQRLLEQQHQQQDDESEFAGEDAIDASEAGPQQDTEDELTEAGGGLLHGDGTGQSDDIEGTTPSGKPVLLSDGEYVIDAPTVAALGDGSTEAGARRLDALRKQIRRDAYGNDKQAKPMARGGKPMTLRIP